MRPEQPPGPPATLGEVRWLDVRSLLASCKACTHETVLNVDSLPDTVPLSWFAARFVCKCCDAVGAYILPSWSEKPDGAPIAVEEPQDLSGALTADYLSG
jgi:hypothetical protein